MTYVVLSWYKYSTKYTQMPGEMNGIMIKKTSFLPGQYVYVHIYDIYIYIYPHTKMAGEIRCFSLTWRRYHMLQSLCLICGTDWHYQTIYHPSGVTLKVRLHGRRQAARLARDMLQRDLLRGNSVYMVGSCRARLLHIIHVSAVFGVGVIQRKLRQLLATACAARQL